MFAEGTQRVRTSRLAFVERTLKLVSHLFLVRYELVLVSFEVRYQFVMASLDGHIRRGFQRTRAYPSFISFLQYGYGTSA